MALTRILRQAKRRPQINEKGDAEMTRCATTCVVGYPAFLAPVVLSFKRFGTMTNH